jgi:hypothetical protein
MKPPVRVYKLGGAVSEDASMLAAWPGRSAAGMHAVLVVHGGGSTWTGC